MFHIRKKSIDFTQALKILILVSFRVDESNVNKICHRILKSILLVIYIFLEQ